MGKKIEKMSSKAQSRRVVGEEDRDFISTRLAEWFRHHWKTQPEAALAIGESQQSVAAWSNGQRTMQYPTWRKLVTRFRLNANRCFGADGPLDIDTPQPEHVSLIAKDVARLIADALWGMQAKPNGEKVAQAAADAAVQLLGLYAGEQRFSTAEVLRQHDVILGKLRSMIK